MSVSLPRVTIAMPVFNGSNYLAEAIESALAQTYPNTEIIVVNDGSTDSGATRAVAEAYGDRIRYVERAHEGVSSALNAAIAAMTGDAFCWLSHDDLFAPEKLEAQVKFRADLGARHACLFSDYELIDARGLHLSFGLVDHEDMVRAPQRALYRGQINGCTVFIPRDVLTWAGPFDYADDFTQDYRMWRRIASRYDFFHQPQVLVKTRLHPAQGSCDERFAAKVDQFWTGLIGETSEVQRVQMEGSSRRFYEEVAQRLRRHTQSVRTAEFAESAAAAPPKLAFAQTPGGASTTGAEADYLVFTNSTLSAASQAGAEQLVSKMSAEGALTAIRRNARGKAELLAAHRIVFLGRDISVLARKDDIEAVWADITERRSTMTTKAARHIRDRLSMMWAKPPIAEFWFGPPPTTSLHPARDYLDRADRQRRLRDADEARSARSELDPFGSAGQVTEHSPRPFKT